MELLGGELPVMVFPAQLQRSIVEAILDCPALRQPTGPQLLKPVAPQSIQLFQESPLIAFTLHFTRPTDTHGLAEERRKNNSLTATRNEESNAMATSIGSASRTDALRGEGGNDSFAASGSLSPSAAVMIDGGTGTDCP
jgi:hypothetical protein